MPSLLGEIFVGILLGPTLVRFPISFVMLGETWLILLVIEAGIDSGLTQKDERGRDERDSGDVRSRPMRQATRVRDTHQTRCPLSWPRTKSCTPCPNSSPRPRTGSCPPPSRPPTHQPMPPRFGVAATSTASTDDLSAASIAMTAAAVAVTSTVAAAASATLMVRRSTAMETAGVPYAVSVLVGSGPRASRDEGRRHRAWQSRQGRSPSTGSPRSGGGSEEGGGEEESLRGGQGNRETIDTINVPWSRRRSESELKQPFACFFLSGRIIVLSSKLRENAEKDRSKGYDHA